MDRVVTTILDLAVVVLVLLGSVLTLLGLYLVASNAVACLA